MSLGSLLLDWCVIQVDDLPQDRVFDRVRDLDHFFRSHHPHLTALSWPEALSMAKQCQHTYVVFQKSGYMFQDTDRDITAMIQHMMDNDLDALAELDVKHSYPTVNPTLIILSRAAVSDAEDWYTSGKFWSPIPIIEYDNPHLMFFQEYSVGASSVRGGQRQRKYHLDQTFGTGLVRSLLQNNHQVSQIPRDCASNHCYLDLISHKRRIEYLMDHRRFMLPARDANKFMMIHHEHTNKKRKVYAVNSELLGGFIPVRFQGPPKNYIGVAGGIKLVALAAKHGITDHTQFLYVDISSAALNFQRYIHRHWNGDIETYQTVIDTFSCQNPHLEISTHGGDIKTFLEQADIDYTTWIQAWNQYRCCSVRFLELDLLEMPQLLVSTIDEMGPGWVLWYSNSFRMQSAVFFYGREWLQQQEQQLITQLTDLGPGQIHGVNWHPVKHIVNV